MFTHHQETKSSYPEREEMPGYAVFWIMFNLSSLHPQNNQQTIEVCLLWYASLQEGQTKKYSLR